ncbi:MAG TPA: proline iminopeptidase-family hydrolase [Candidatus Babeliales bacterium]|nr:proline iminopeptidase-family hydrolase [Candidatus Babeliales bacterium]
MFFRNVLIILLVIAFYRKSSAMEALQVAEQYLGFGYGNIWTQKWFAESTYHKTPIIFVHGGPGLESGYIINLKILASNRPCIFYDQSGCGKSMVKANVVVEWTLEHYTQELVQLIDRLGFEKIILFGYSWGAAIATNYVVGHADRIEKLVLASPYISTPHLVANYKQLAQSKNIYEILMQHELAGTLSSPAYQEAWSLFFKSFIFSKDPSIFNEFVVNKEILEIMWGNNEFTVTGNLKNMNLIPLLSQLNMPVLLTSGRSDTMTPEYMRLLHTKIHNSKMMIFEQSTHMPHREEQDAYCDVIDNFLRN